MRPLGERVKNKIKSFREVFSRRELLKTIVRGGLIAGLGSLSVYFIKKENELRQSGVCHKPEICLSCQEFNRDCSLDKAQATRKQLKKQLENKAPGRSEAVSS